MPKAGPDVKRQLRQIKPELLTEEGPKPGHQPAVFQTAPEGAEVGRRAGPAACLSFPALDPADRVADQADLVLQSQFPANAKTLLSHS
mgnify:CR=1 FL=1